VEWCVLVVVAVQLVWRSSVGLQWSSDEVEVVVGGWCGRVRVVDDVECEVV
jgi:hypothetical protein